ncbi:MAG: peptidoglycan DD-metalloendopeptidase family protein, partial [Candidatus Binatia bacterium]
SSRLGRFMTPDPLAGTIRNPQSLNRYAYVLNDPINLIDPLGLTHPTGPPGGGDDDCAPGCTKNLLGVCQCDSGFDASDPGLPDGGGREPLRAGRDSLDPWSGELCQEVVTCTPGGERAGPYCSRMIVCRNDLPVTPCRIYRSFFPGHTGVDITTNPKRGEGLTGFGNPVLSPVSGIMLPGESNGQPGGQENYTKVLDPNTKLVHVFVHTTPNKEIPAGSEVKKGDVIGYVDDTGNTTGPHVHYKIYPQGQPRNPLDPELQGYLDDGCERLMDPVAR